MSLRTRLEKLASAIEQRADAETDAKGYGALQEFLVAQTRHSLGEGLNPGTMPALARAWLARQPRLSEADGAELLRALQQIYEAAVDSSAPTEREDRWRWGKHLKPWFGHLRPDEVDAQSSAGSSRRSLAPACLRPPRAFAHSSCRGFSAKWWRKGTRSKILSGRYRVPRAG